MAMINVTAEEVELADSLRDTSNPGSLSIHHEITDAQIARMIELGLLRGDVELGRDFLEPSNYAYDIANRLYDLNIRQ